MLDLTLLDRWQGGDAVLWDYNRAYQGMTIRIQRKGQRGNLHINFVETTHVCCITGWANCFFELTEGPYGYTLLDVTANVKIQAGGIDFEENCEPIYMPL